VRLILKLCFSKTCLNVSKSPWIHSHCPSVVYSLYLVLYIPYITLSHICYQNCLLLQSASYSVAPFFLLFYFLASLLLVRAYSSNSLTPTGGIGAVALDCCLTFTTTIPEQIMQTQYIACVTQNTN
jgi:hypothetical protein